MKNNNLFDIIGKSLLAVFLLNTHAKLFYWLDPIFEKDVMQKFSYLEYNEKTIQALVFGFLFGSITVYILERRKNSPLFVWFVIIIALLDGFAVNWLYNENYTDYWKIAFASTHYTLYTIFIILMYGFAGSEKKMQKTDYKIRANANNANDAKVLQMLKDDLNPKQISEELNINLSTVYRIKKRYENEQD